MKKELTFSRKGLLLLLVFASAAVFSGCRKDKKAPIQFEIIAHQPHLDIPVSGVKWTIKERKSQGFGGGQKLTGWTLEGETDLNGMAHGEFVPKKNLDYSYVISFDYSSANVPNGEYDVNIGSNEARVMYRPISGENNYEIRMLPKMDVQLNYQNTNCYNGSDVFRYKVSNIDEDPNHNFNNQPWSEPQILTGCADYSHNSNRLAGHYI